MGGETYHFRPENNRICDVVTKVHQDRFLSRSKSYRAVAESGTAIDAPLVAERSVKTPQRRTRRFTPPQQAALLPAGRD